MVNGEKKAMLSKRYPIITYEDFYQIDMGTYECKATTAVWENKTDILITGWETYAGYGYDGQTAAQCAKQSNMCLDWIEENKEYIQKIISEKSILWIEYGFEMAGKNFLDRLCLRRIQIEISVQDEAHEVLACMYLEVKPFFFRRHCHCIKVTVQAQEDGTYKADLMEDVPQFLSEIRNALKQKDMEACEWAKNHELFYAFDDEGNMLVVVKRQFCLSIENKLISETDNDNMQTEGLSKNKSERSALYFVNAKYGARWGTPMPLGFITKELTCKNGVFTITSSSGHKAVSGTFLVMQEALTMIEMLYCTRGVTEEEIEKCYYTFLVEDHQKYLFHE